MCTLHYIFSSAYKYILTLFLCEIIGAFRVTRVLSFLITSQEFSARRDVSYYTGWCHRVGGIFSQRLASIFIFTRLAHRRDVHLPTPLTLN